MNYVSTANIEEVMTFYNLGDKTFETEFSFMADLMDLHGTSNTNTGKPKKKNPEILRLLLSVLLAYHAVSETGWNLRYVLVQ